MDKDTQVLRRWVFFLHAFMDAKLWLEYKWITREYLSMFLLMSDNMTVFPTPVMP